MYLGALINKVETADGTECWMISAEKYVKADVDNVKLKLSKSNCSLTSCCNAPMTNTYHPSEDHRWDLPGDYPVFAVVTVIYHCVERIWIILVTPIFSYNIYNKENILSM